MQEQGVEDILAVDVAGKMLEALTERYGQASLGNEKRVRTWLGDICSVPAYQVTKLHNEPTITPADMLQITRTRRCYSP